MNLGARHPSGVLPGRRSFALALELAASEALDDGFPFSVTVLQIQGPATEHVDEVEAILPTLAKLLRLAGGRNASLARIEPLRFAVMHKHTGLPEAAELAESQRAAVALRFGDWAHPLRWTELHLPEAGRKSLKDGELKMAKQLIGDMTETWKPDAYADKFTAAVHALVAKRVDAGQTEAVEPMEDAAPSGGGNVVDLTELLKQSLGGKGKSANASKPASEKPAATQKPAAKKAASAKAPARKRA